MFAFHKHSETQTSFSQALKYTPGQGMNCLPHKQFPKLFLVALAGKKLREGGWWGYLTKGNGSRFGKVQCWYRGLHVLGHMPINKEGFPLTLKLNPSPTVSQHTLQFSAELSAPVEEAWPCPSAPQRG